MPIPTFAWMAMSINTHDSKEGNEAMHFCLDLFGSLVKVMRPQASLFNLSPSPTLTWHRSLPCLSLYLCLSCSGLKILPFFQQQRARPGQRPKGQLRLNPLSPSHLASQCVYTLASELDQGSKEGSLPCPLCSSLPYIPK